MRIGIYGGTFNPIHTAHVHLVREFIKRLSLDRVILIPTGTPPHKAIIPSGECVSTLVMISFRSSLYPGVA